VDHFDNLVEVLFHYWVQNRVMVNEVVVDHVHLAYEDHFEMMVQLGAYFLAGLWTGKMVDFLAFKLSNKGVSIA